MAIDYLLHLAMIFTTLSTLHHQIYDVLRMVSLAFFFPA
jgi:hypothetical protein